MSRQSLILALASSAAFLTACPAENNGNADANTPADAGRTDNGGGGNDSGGNADAVSMDVEEMADGGDAATPDAMPGDTGTMDAMPTGPVTVRIIQNLMPQPNVPVFFHDPSGAVITSTVTDMNGEASAIVPSGGMVTSTAITPFISGPSVRRHSVRAEGGGPGFGEGFHTVVGVEPGDVYVWGVQFNEPPPPPPPVGDLLISLPGGFVNAQSYSVEFGCGLYYFLDEMTPEQVDVTDNCVGTSTVVDVLAQARDINNEVIAFAVARNVPVGRGVTVTMPAWDENLINADFAVTNAPNTALTGDVQFNLVRRGFQYEDTQRNGDFMAGGLRLPLLVSDFGDAHDVMANLVLGASQTLLVGRFDVNQPLAFDFVNDNLPHLTDATVDAITDVERPTITWTLGQGSVEDFVLVGFNNDAVLWTVLAPPTATEVKMPELPDAFAAMRPTANTVHQPPLVIVISSSLLLDYAAYRVPHGGAGFFGLQNVVDLTGAPNGTKVTGAGINTGN